MRPEEIIRAWKDQKFREALSDGERAMLPDNPVGVVELTDEDLGEVDGATTAPCVAGTLLASHAMSCFPGCANTVWHGTCAIASIGCCSGGGGGDDSPALEE